MGIGLRIYQDLETSNIVKLFNEVSLSFGTRFETHFRVVKFGTRSRKPSVKDVLKEGEGKGGRSEKDECGDTGGEVAGGHRSQDTSG